MPSLRRTHADRTRAQVRSPSPLVGSSNADDSAAGASAMASVDFVEACHRLVGMLMTFAQQDMMAHGHTPGMFALARFRGRFIDIDAQPMLRAVVTGKAEDTAVLTPEGLGLDEANQIFMDLAGSCGIAQVVDGAQAPSAAISIRVTNDVWMPTEGVTPEGVQFLRQMPREHQLLVSGALPLWVAEFLSPGARWYGRSSHPVQGRSIQPTVLITAAVGDILNMAPRHGSAA